MEFIKSETHKNLMRAFAGESQARNRYTFAAELCKEKKLYVLNKLFTFTAEQERAHGKVFYDLLKELTGSTVTIDGGYPVDVYNDPIKLLSSSAHNEFEEHGDVYPAFARVASQEGYEQVANKFKMIAQIEKCHGDRFKKFGELLEQGKLFRWEGAGFMCLNCGYETGENDAPGVCPICDHPQGYFLRSDLVF